MNEEYKKIALWDTKGPTENQDYGKVTFASICEAVYNADGDWERDE